MEKTRAFEELSMYNRQIMEELYGYKATKEEFKRGEKRTNIVQIAHKIKALIHKYDLSNHPIRPLCKLDRILLQAEVSI